MILRKATLISLLVAAMYGMQSAEFATTRPAKDMKLEPKQFLGAVKT